MSVFSYSRSFVIPSAQVHGAQQNVAKFAEPLGVQVTEAASTGNPLHGFSNFQLTLKGESEALSQAFRAVGERLALLAR